MTPKHYKTVFKSVWTNGAEIEVGYYKEPNQDEDPSDRIHLFIKQAGEEKRGWMMNASDAVDIITGLSSAIAECIENDVPMCVTK
jgi:hypothetical protein